MAIEKRWYLLNETVLGSTLKTWEFLGFRNLEALRDWVRDGRKEGWLKPGHHFKFLYPNREKSAIMLHLERCHDLDTTKVV